MYKEQHLLYIYWMSSIVKKYKEGSSIPQSVHNVVEKTKDTDAQNKNT